MALLVKRVLKLTHTAELHVEPFKGLDSSARQQCSAAAGRLALFPRSEEPDYRAIMLQGCDSTDNKDKK